MPLHELHTSWSLSAAETMRQRPSASNWWRVSNDPSSVDAFEAAGEAARVARGTWTGVDPEPVSGAELEVRVRLGGVTTWCSATQAHEIAAPRVFGARSFDSVTAETKRLGRLRAGDGGVRPGAGRAAVRHARSEDESE